MVKLIRPYIKSNWKSIILYFVTSIILWGINIVIPVLSGFYIDSLVSNTSSFIIAFVFSIAIINIVNVFIQYISAFLTTKLNNTLLFQISNNIYQKIFRTDINKINNIDHQYFIDQLNKDVAAIVDFFAGNVCNFILHFTTIIVSIIVVYKADKILGMFIFLLLPIYIYTYKCFRNKLYEINLKYKEQLNKFHSVKAEQITKIEFIKRNILYSEMEEKLGNAFKKYMKVTMQQVKINYVFSNLNQILLIICYVLVIYIGGMKVVEGDLSIGYFTIINTYFAMIISSTTYFLGFSSIYQQTKVSADRINAILINKEESMGTIEVNNVENIIISDLQLFIQQQKIKQKINMILTKGKIWVIEGANGCGKTTLINTIIGYYSDNYKGEIYYNHINLKEIDTEKLRKFTVSYIEQMPELMNVSLNEYLCLGINTKEIDKEYKNLLVEKFNLKSLFYRHQESDVINNYGQNLSGGERQKIAIVRGLSKNADIYLFDEPSSALDKKSVDILIEILLEIKIEKIIIIVTHDNRLKEIADELINLEDLYEDS